MIIGKIFLLWEFFRACSKMKSAQWGFSFTKSNIHFLKQLCLYFNYMTLTVKKKLIYLFKIRNSFCIFLKIKSKEQEIFDLFGSITLRLFNVFRKFFFSYIQNRLKKRLWISFFINSFLKLIQIIQNLKMLRNLCYSAGKFV